MQYEELAKEMLEIRAEYLSDPAYQKISKLMRGVPFVLCYLYKHGGTAQPRDLTKKLAVSSARTARILNWMEEKGLVSRRKDDKDSRNVIVQLTPAGEEAIQQMYADVLQYTRDMLERLGPEDAQEYIRIQRKLLHC